METKESSGIDKRLNKHFKATKSQLTNPLTLLFNQILNT